MKISYARELQLSNVCDLLATEFIDDPVLNFAFNHTTQEQRVENLRRFFDIYVNLAREYGGILIAENEAGVLVYFQPDIMKIIDKKKVSLDNQLREECGVYYASVVSLMNGLNHYHPRNPPHYYIFVIAVRHACRRQGVATSLLAELNNILDKDEFPCYSECTTFGTTSIFRQSGYDVTEPSILIEGFPMLFPVWREPQKIGGIV